MSATRSPFCCPRPRTAPLRVWGKSLTKPVVTDADFVPHAHDAAQAQRVWQQLASDKGQRTEIGAKVHAMCDTDPCRATWVLVNEASTPARIECRTGASKDARSSLKTEVEVVNVPANETVVALHMVAASEATKPKFRARFDHKHD